MFLENDLIMIVDPLKRTDYLIKLQKGQQFHTHRGFINHEELINLTEGSEVFTNKEYKYIVFKPDAKDILMKVKRSTQIIYPKDAAYIVFLLNIESKSRVIECGMGSGALTTYLAKSVKPEGKIYTYEKRAEFIEKAEKYFDRVGLAPYIEIKNKTVEEGFDEKDVDAVILDLPDASGGIEAAFAALKTGGKICCLITAIEVLKKTFLKMQALGFVRVDAREIIERFMLVRDKEGVRPSERMNGFSGYILSGTKK